MPRMKSPFYAFLFALFLLGQIAHAQEPASRWTFGAEIGLSVEHTEPSEPGFSSDTWNSVQLGNLTADYRLLRWLGLRAEGNFFLHNKRTVARYFNANAAEVYVLQWSTTTPMVGLTLGPQFLLRAGQGDIIFDFLAGGFYHRSRVKGTTAFGEVYDFRFRGRVSPLVKLGLSYTYWPTKRFGINFGGEIAIFPFTNRFDSSNVPQVQVDLSEQYPNTPEEVLLTTITEFDGTASAHLTLGFMYRLQ